MRTKLCDRDLVRAALSGDLAALETLTRRYQDAVYRGVLCYVPVSADAREIVQDTFLRAFERLSR